MSSCVHDWVQNKEVSDYYARRFQCGKCSVWAYQIIPSKSTGKSLKDSPIIPYKDGALPRYKSEFLSGPEVTVRSSVMGRGPGTNLDDYRADYRSDKDD